MSTANISHLQDDLLKKIHSFSETYKSAYTHGLESIYSLEAVDLTSIRRVNEDLESYTAGQKKMPGQKLEQGQFDFGEMHRDWISSFILQESIDLLSIPYKVQLLLEENHVKVIGDLIDCDFSSLIHVPGIGQGHIDDIRRKLQDYIQGRSLRSCRQVDLAAWIRVLIASLDKRKTFVTLEAYGLSDLIRLSASEKLDILRLSLDDRQDWMEQTVEALQHGNRRQIFIQGMRKITEALIRPWIANRQGLAVRWEIVERFTRLADQALLVPGVIKLFSELYFDGRFPFRQFLPEVDHDLYSGGESFAIMYDTVIDKAMTYFYNPSVVYTLEHLVALISREFAARWENFPDGFLEKALRNCSKFRVRKGAEGELEVRLR